MDGFTGYATAVEEQLPQADKVMDPFHVVHLAADKLALPVLERLAATGLIVGLWFPGVGIAAMVGIIAHFCAATAAHVRAHFLGSEFWIN